jgi:hypothetical protein
MLSQCAGLGRVFVFIVLCAELFGGAVDSPLVSALAYVCLPVLLLVLGPAPGAVNRQVRFGSLTHW